MNYLCMRCGYETNFKTNIKSHLDKMIKCPKNMKAIGKNDRELYDLSLIPSKIKSKNIFNCKVCNKNYSRIDSYHRHLKNSKICNQDNNIDNIDKIENNDKVNIIESNINNIKLNNVSNSNITCGDTINNINKNINIYILPFDEHWTTEHLDDKDKCYIISSLMKYTTLLNELLENDENLNVIVEENTNEALVFKNEEEKYVNIKKKDLYSKTMKELKNILIGMTNKIINCNDCETNYSISFKKNLEKEILGIIKKYDDYEEDNECNPF